MKTKTQVMEINHEDLVDFFSTALYGSHMFGARYDSIEYYELKDANENDCYEDKLARREAHEKKMVEIKAKKEAEKPKRKRQRIVRYEKV